MKKAIRKIYKALFHYGIDPKKFLIALQTQWYNKDFKEIKKQKGNNTTFFFGRKYPVLTERESEGGIMSGHYFHQDLYIARMVNLANPKKHLDIGSRTDGFIAHVASFREIELIDIRKIDSKVKNILFRQADLMKLPIDLINYCDSISSLHAIEHFGLGRHGDPIEYFGYIKAISNIAKILITGGIFYFSVPMGPQRIEFNAQRVFSLSYLITLLNQYFSISSFSYVNDKGDFFEGAQFTDIDVESNFECFYGCAIFTLIKI